MPPWLIHTRLGREQQFATQASRSPSPSRSPRATAKLSELPSAWPLSEYRGKRQSSSAQSISPSPSSSVPLSQISATWDGNGTVVVRLSSRASSNSGRVCMRASNRRDNFTSWVSRREWSLEGCPCRELRIPKIYLMNTREYFSLAECSVKKFVGGVLASEHRYY